MTDREVLETYKEIIVIDEQIKMIHNQIEHMSLTLSSLTRKMDDLILDTDTV